MNKRVSMALCLIFVIGAVSACSASDISPTDRTNANEQSYSSPESSTPETLAGDSSGEDGEEDVTGENATEENSAAENESATTLFSDTNVGDIVVFGNYEQDGDMANGQEPIEWEVLSIQDESMLIASRYALDCQPYNSEDADIEWADCTLRKWLNDDFYNAAFSADEQKQIQEAELSNAGNEYWPGGADTYDKVFCLSMDEIIAHYDLKRNEEDNAFYSEALMIHATPYAENNGVETFGQGPVWWWVRSPGSLGANVCIADHNGEIGWGFRHRILVGMQMLGVRPALWLNKTGASVQQSGKNAADGSLSAVSESDILSLYEEVKRKDAEIDLWFQTEATDMTSMRNKANERYELWNTFLKSLLAYFEASLSAQEWNDLSAEQQVWSEEAEALALEHASQYEGGTAYPLEYSAAYSRETKARAEALMQRINTNEARPN